MNTLITLLYQFNHYLTVFAGGMVVGCILARGASTGQWSIKP
jgi:hypothetical protein